jgi:hypothetical protein
MLQIINDNEVTTLEMTFKDLNLAIKYFNKEKERCRIKNAKQYQKKKAIKCLQEKIETDTQQI